MVGAEEARYCEHKMAEYDSAIALAKKLIDKKGRQINVRRTTLVDGPNPLDPPTQTNTDYPVRAVFLDYEQSLINETLIKVGDQRCLIPAIDVPISISTADLIIDGSSVYSIKNDGILKPGDQVIIYDLQVRGVLQ